MAWTSPKTFVANDPLTASELNTHLRDNLLETAVAKVTAAGDLTQGSGSHALARLAIGNPFQTLRVNSAGNAAEWGDPTSYFKQKESTTTISSDNSLNDDPELTLTVPAGHYLFYSFVNYATTTTADFKIRYSLSDTGVYNSFGWIIKKTLGGSVYAQSIDAIFETDYTADGSGLFGLGYVLTFCMVDFTDDDTITVQWSQNTSDAGNTSVLEGLSWINCLRLGAYIP